MWECANCGETVEYDFDVCWNCQTEKGNLSTKDIWQQKSGEELITASEHLSDYTKGAEEIIRAELRRRRMPEPEPTLRTIEDEQSKLPMNLAGKAVPIGIVIIVIGVALIIISPNLLFVEHVPGGFLNMGMEQITDLRNVTLLFGVALLIVGAIISAVGFSQFMSSRPTMPLAPTTQPVVTSSVLPKSVELGNTPDEVQAAMGQPDKIINLGARVIHIYNDMKIIYVNGKVADVQLS